MTTDAQSTPTPVDVNAYISERIVLTMWRRKLKHNNVAMLAGFSTAAFSKSINGQRRWQAEDVYAVATALGVEPGELLPRLDLNQQPAVYQPAQVRALPVRHLTLVEDVA